MPESSTPITDAARLELARRVPVGTYDPATGAVTFRPADATDVKGMLDPVLDAIEQLEARLAQSGNA